MIYWLRFSTTITARSSSTFSLAVLETLGVIRCVKAIIGSRPETFLGWKLCPIKDCESYWSRNGDLAESVGIMNPATTIPVRLYGDGADSTKNQKFEVTSLLPVLGLSGSTLDSRIMLACRNVGATTDQGRDAINTVITWSFKCLRSLVQIVRFESRPLRNRNLSFS